MDPREIIQEKRQRVPKLIIGLLLVTCIGLGAFFGFREWYADDGSTDSVPTFEQVTVERSNIATTLTTSGTATARESAELNFGSSGVVETVEVELGDQVDEGDVLATLDNRDAQNGLIIAQNNLLEAELRLSQLLEAPSEAVLSDAEKTISSAMSQLASAKLNHETALDPPTAVEIAAADATVAQRQSDVITANRDVVAADRDVTTANREVQPAYADLRIIQGSLCSLMQIQPETLIDDAETLWREVEGPNVSLKLDPNAFVHGSNSLKIELPRYKELKAVIAKKTFSALDLSEFDVIEFWVRSDTSIDGGYFDLAIYDSESFITPLETFAIPALKAGVWTLVSLPISKLSSDIKVIGVGVRFSEVKVRMSSNRSLWLDEIIAISPDPICRSASLPLSEESLKFLTNKVDESTSAIDAVTTRSKDFIKSNNSYVKALDSSAKALDSRAKALDSLDVAAANLASATAKRTSLDDPIPTSEAAQLEAAIVSANAALTSALSKKDDLLSGPSENEIKLQELNIAKAKQSVNQAQETLTDMVLLAPFSGQIGAVNVSEGVWVTASTAAFSLVDLDSVGVDLTVSESDFIGLTSGDLGMATFDSIPDQPFIIKLANITSLPQITQGVVTYPAQAEFLSMREAAEILPRLGSLMQGSSGSSVTGSGPGIGSGIDMQALRRCAAEQVGREVSSPSDLTPSEMNLVREKCFSGSATGGNSRTGSTGTRVKPAIGMNASVTMLLEIKENVLIVPAQAIQSDKGREVVTLLGQDQMTTTSVPVSIGITNGDRTEIISGLEEGQVVLIPGASDASIPISSPSNGSTNRPGQRGAPR
ncbi:MAG: HlyD family efflux transporter periplasmic adaptor subunit [SAR202 cluster bacterium]|nr:HlyD family efflux transporter periplasmic adaptor subunit [SAR202 cluster bacterium]